MQSVLQYADPNPACIRYRGQREHESRLNLTDGYLWLWSFVPSSQKLIAFQNYKVISVWKFRLSHSFQWLLLAAATVEI